MRFLLLGDASSYHTHRWADSIREEGHEVLTLSLEPSIDGDGAVLTHPPVGKLKYILSVPAIKERVKEWKPDIIFAHFLPNYGLMGSFLKGGLKVLALWGSDILHWAFKSPLHRSVARRILYSYDLVVVDANFLVGLLEREFGFPKDRVVVIPFGVRRELREMEPPPLPDSPLHFVSLRRHEPIFNHGEILRFVRRVSEDYPVRLTYLQEGSLTGEIRSQARRMGLDVRFTGRVSYDEYVRILRSAHFCISIPSRDASSVSLLECMALGGVPIVSDIPANREWVREETGIISPPTADEMYRRFRAKYTPSWWKRARPLNRSLILKRCNWEENLRRFLRHLRSYL